LEKISKIASNWIKLLIKAQLA